ncbi:MAG: DinB family protein [Desulfobacterales bacterium]|jgi:hypothetical protein
MNQKVDRLVEVAGQLEQAVDSAVERWRDLHEERLKFCPSANAWSIKEIIGHLIDSASNNHQRFVRLQLEQLLIFPDYSTDNILWVRIQKYQERTWAELLDLWGQFNYQLAHIMRSVDPDCLSHTWQVDSNTRYTLFDLMTDYLRHLEDHLIQIGDTLNASKDAN